jgi:tetratricopeptide (TPR) repeat protein
VLLLNNECEEALFQCEKGLSIQPHHDVCWGNYWDAVACLGDYDRWFNNLKKNNIQFWEEHRLTERYEEAYYKRGWIAFLKELASANDEIFGLIDNNESYNRMGLYIKSGEYDKAMDIAEKLYEPENYNPNLPYISAKSFYDKMKHNPRYIDLLKKMNLPVD